MFKKSAFRWLATLFSCAGVSGAVYSQGQFPHRQAHAHNDYEHARPLLDALSNGFTSVEADVHLFKGELRVAHDVVVDNSPDLETAYFLPLDSILKRNHGRVFSGYESPFFLMIDIKTEAVPTYRAIRKLLERYPALVCGTDDCAVKIFLSGNRPMEMVLREGYHGIELDGRPDDLGKNYTAEMMPLVSDRFDKWSSWNGEGPPSDMRRIADLAERVHREGKLLRLWAIPDNENGWKALLEAGVDLINSDRLAELHQFLAGRKKE